MPLKLDSVLIQQNDRQNQIQTFLVRQVKRAAPYYSSKELSESLGIPDQTVRGLVGKLMRSGYCVRLGKGPVFSTPKFIKLLEKSHAQKPA